MALKKDVIFENGVKINYHYISDIQVDNKNKIAKIKVDSYIDKSYRDKEIKNEENKSKYETLLNLIMSENKKEEEDRNIEQVIKYSEEANILVSEFKDEVDLKVVTTDIELKNVTDFNMSNLYNLLKKEELFKDAKNI